MPNQFHPIAASAAPTSSAPELSRHASIRLQQRGIPSWFLGQPVDRGRSRHDGHGVVIKTVDRSTRQHLKTELTRTEYSAAERYFSVYAVVASDHAVVTAAHRTGRKHLH